MTASTAQKEIGYERDCLAMEAQEATDAHKHRRQGRAAVSVAETSHAASGAG